MKRIALLLAGLALSGCSLVAQPQPQAGPNTVTGQTVTCQRPDTKRFVTWHDCTYPPRQP